MGKNDNCVDNEKLALHYKYLIVITLVIICISIGSMFINTKVVVATLSNASVLLSIVLAIIAILISLWDVAGQRNSLIDVKTQVENLKKYVEDINETSVQSKEILRKLEDFEGRFSVDFDPIFKELANIKDTIVESGNNNGIVEKINNLENILDVKLNQTDVMKSLEKNNIQRASTELILNWVLEVLQQKKVGDVFDDKMVYAEIKNQYPNLTNQYILRRMDMIKVLSILTNLGNIERIDENFYKIKGKL